MPLELNVDWTIDLQGVVNRLIRTPLLNSGVDIFPVPEIRECLFANVGQEIVQEKFYSLRFDTEHPICLSLINKWIAGSRIKNRASEGGSNGWGQSGRSLGVREYPWLCPRTARTRADAREARFSVEF